MSKLDPKSAKILSKANFAYLVSLSAPDADAEALRMGVDWCIWVSKVAIDSLQFSLDFPLTCVVSK